MANQPPARALPLNHAVQNVRAEPGPKALRAQMSDSNLKIGQRRRVGGTTRTRASNHGDLRHHSGKIHVLEKDFPIAGKRFNALLDASSTRVVETDHRHP